MKQSTINMFVKSLSLFPTDDSSKIEFTMQGRKWGDECWKQADNLSKAKKNHYKATVEWDMLKEDSKGDESTAKALQSKGNYIMHLEEQIANHLELQEAVLKGYEAFFDKPYVPYVKTTNSLSSQEIDSKWSPKTY